MSSWATMLAATGFKPDMPNQTLAVLPAAPGDFRAPWVKATGFGTISRFGRALLIHCVYGRLELKSLKLQTLPHSAHIGTLALAIVSTTTEDVAALEFSSPVALTAGQTLTVL